MNFHKHLIFFLLICLPITGFSQDRVFTRTYQSTVIAKDRIDLEYYSTLKSGKAGYLSPYAFGRKLEQRVEFEYGLGGNVQTAFYLNTSNFKFALKDTTPGAYEKQTESGFSFSNEWKIKLSDPVANGIGSALYFELTVGADEYETELKFIFDKKIGKNLVAFNLNGELELETEIEKSGTEFERETDWEIPVEANLAFLHFFTPKFGLGLEARSHNPIANHKGWESSVLFAGPGIYFNEGRFFCAFNAMPQLINLYQTKYAPSSLDFDDHEGLEFRLLIGFSL